MGQQVVHATQNQVNVEMEVLTTSNWFFGRPIPVAQIANDCQYRAHLIAASLLMRRPEWVVGKVFVQGELRPSNGLVSWGFHVATVVVGDGSLWVMDPSFSSEALSLDDWLSLIPVAEETPPAKVWLVNASVLELNQINREGAIVRTVTFSVGLEESLQALTNRRGFRTRERGKLRVHSIEGQAVQFVGGESTDPTGWFWVRQGQDLRILEAALGSPSTLTVRYERVPLRWFPRHRSFLFVTSVVDE